jgi:hypothetical protein
MIWPNSRQVISEGSRSTVGDLEMMDARLGLEDNVVASCPPAVCKFCLEMIGHANEIFVESANSDGFLSVERKISPDELVDFN